MAYYELYHHGILGQKWGVRRYQNKDGSLTAAGRKHVGIGEKSGGGPKLFKLKKAKINGKDITPKKQIVKAEEDKEENKDLFDDNKPKTIDEMSTKDLQDRINRMRLEQQYKELISPKTPVSEVNNQQNQKKAKDWVKTLGTVATVTGTVVTLATNIDKISKIINDTANSRKPKIINGEHVDFIKAFSNKPTSSMSDSDIANAIKRMNAEQTYRKLRNELGL